MFTGLLLSNAALMSIPFFLADGLKIVYDLILYRNFRSIKPPNAAQQPAHIRSSGLEFLAAQEPYEAVSDPWRRYAKITKDPTLRKDV